MWDSWWCWLASREVTENWSMSRGWRTRGHEDRPIHGAGPGPGLTGGTGCTSLPLDCPRNLPQSLLSISNPSQLKIIAELSQLLGGIYLFMLVQLISSTLSCHWLLIQIQLLLTGKLPSIITVPCNSRLTDKKTNAFYGILILRCGVPYISLYLLEKDHLWTLWEVLSKALNRKSYLSRNCFLLCWHHLHMKNVILFIFP